MTPPRVTAAPARGSQRRAVRPITVAATPFHAARLATDDSPISASAAANSAPPPRAKATGATTHAAASSTISVPSSTCCEIRRDIRSYAVAAAPKASALAMRKCGRYFTP